MLDERQNILLLDVLDSARMIRSYLDQVSQPDFMASTEKQDAVLRRLEIIGEAVSRLSPQTRDLFPSIPFRSIRGMRNLIAHDYGAVDLEQVWHTVGQPVIHLIHTLEQYFEDEKHRGE